MMRGVQDAPPENPDSFPLHIEERNNCKPPVLSLLCQKLQTCAGELDHSGGISLRRAVLRQDFVRRHFRQSQKLGKEATFRQQLVLDNLFDATRARMWLEREIVRRELMPDRVEFVYLTRICPHEVL